MKGIAELFGKRATPPDSTPPYLPGVCKPVCANLSPSPLAPDSVSLKRHSVLSNIASCSGRMIVAVKSLKLFCRDMAMLQDVVNHNPRSFRSDLRTERQDAGVYVLFGHVVMTTRNSSASSPPLNDQEAVGPASCRGFGLRRVVGRRGGSRPRRHRRCVQRA